ncbi:SpoIID/LytB domain-containing protein [uncultured Gemmiger sp.]|uniref:SpoIID/LytB domain-containing protein n=1 Tax=uncultured Gemmiger sp. TaxID=1623490 RepID=UPI0025DB5BD3|nr:SpoIID/LytB domain-containing protein [uncultured Gemmiger sp.]
MKTETRRTLFGAVLLAGLAAAAPLLCLIPLFAPQAVPGPQAGSTDPAGSGTAAPAPAATDRPQPLDILLWDESAGQAVSLPAREYLMGAAACEMPIDWPDEALKAQMVASHSWALYQLAQGDSSGTAITVNSAQCSGWTSAQVLQSRWGDDFAANWQRLGELADTVLYQLVLYDGQPAATCYHAISCGHTQASQRVWAQALPYLQGVDSAWDAQADGYEVTIQYSAQQVSDALYAGLNIDTQGNPDQWFGEILWDSAGYVDTVTVCGQAVTGPQMRSALSLRSACFAIAWQDGQFVITTRGYGHGVGLSQAGARAMAAGGSSWREILAYYFPGTEITDAA